MVFHKHQKNTRVQKYRERDEIDNALYSSISEAEVTRTGGQGTFFVRRVGNDFAGTGEVMVMVITSISLYCLCF